MLPRRIESGPNPHRSNPMPHYMLERQYLLPVYQHLALEAPDLDTACREALDDVEHDWQDAREDYESSRPRTNLSRSKCTPC